MVFSGVVKGRAKGGEAIMFSEKLRCCVKEWKCESERLMKVRLQIDGRWVTLIQVYAPIDDSVEEMKSSFYMSLEEMIACVSKRDHLVLMGDLNARVGRDVSTWREVIGRHGEGMGRWQRIEMAKGCYGYVP